MTRRRGIRWSRAIRQRPSSLTAFSALTVHIFGSLLIIASVFTAVAGLVALVDAARSWSGRALGIGLLAVAAIGFWIGRWLLGEYAADRRP